MKVRPERDEDYAAIRSVNEEAFGESIEADLVEMIRASNRFVPELSLVAESGGQTLGHVMLSYVDIEPGGHRVLQVGPVAVLPSHQRRGIGSALMQEAIRRADARGEPLLLLEGNPAYYERFGFTRADAAGIEPPPEAHGPQYFMIRPLSGYDPAFAGPGGVPAGDLRRAELAGCAERGPADPARPGPAAGKSVEGQQKTRGARGSSAFLSASVPGHGRLSFSIGMSFPALELRP